MSDASVTGLAFIAMLGPVVAAATTFVAAKETRSRWVIVPGIGFWLGALYLWIVTHTWLTHIHTSWFHAPAGSYAGMTTLNIIAGVITAIVSFAAFGTVLFDDGLYRRPQPQAQRAKKED